MPRPRKRLATPLDDPGFARSVERLLEEHRSSTLPNEHALNVAAQITPGDVDKAEALWNEAQRRAGTGLEGMLSARTEKRDG
jgi:hypothetical protein